MTFKDKTNLAESYIGLGEKQIYRFLKKQYIDFK
jgi:hypothetical protein